MEDNTELLRGGYSVIHLHRDRPPKVRIGDGYRFFTNDKFGNLGIFGKLIISGSVTMKEACGISGVSRWRGSRFVNALSKMYGPMFCKCGRIMPHVGNCKGINGKSSVNR